MAGFDLDDTLALLERTPSVLDALLRGLPAGWLAADEGPGTWTPVDVVGHLLHGEHEDWVPRTERLLSHGTAVPWEPFDPARLEVHRAGRDLEELLDEFAERRAANVTAIRALDLTAADLDREAIHPGFGRPVTLRQHLSTWAVHDIDHTKQALRAMALRHVDDVGPWTEILTILH